MVNFKLIKQYIIDLYYYYKFNDNIIDIKNKINYLFKLNLNEDEKYVLLHLLLYYNIHKLNYELFKQIIKQNNIKILFNYNKKDNDISLNYYSNYNNMIHNYLQDKMNDNLDNLQNYIIKYKLNNDIYNLLIKINEYIDNTNFIYNIRDIGIYYFDDIIKELTINYKKIEIFKKIKYPLNITQYDEKNNFQTYQCYFKSAINFFLNNGNFLNQFSINNINIDNDKLSSDVIDSQKGGNNEELYNIFTNMFKDDYINNNIDHYYILLRNKINEILDNKYYLGIPGFKVYPYYIIQDLLIKLNDVFSRDCIIEYNKKYKLSNKEIYESNKINYDEEINYNVINKYSYIYDCNKNCFLNDIYMIHNSKKQYNINILDYNKLLNYNKKYENDGELSGNCISRLPFQYINNKYYYINNIKNYLHNINNTPINLLIACPIHDITSIYLLNNKINLYKYDYNMISSYINWIQKHYNIEIIYPYIISINKKQYKLHSFIILINNNKLDSHFVYYKVNNNNLIRFDTSKDTINKNNVHTKIKFIQDEFNNLYNDNYIKDNLNYKVIFCYYRRIN